LGHGHCPLQNAKDTGYDKKKNPDSSPTIMYVDLELEQLMDVIVDVQPTNPAMCVVNFGKSLPSIN